VRSPCSLGSTKDTSLWSILILRSRPVTSGDGPGEGVQVRRGERWVH
jgi:hypothetical protein